jgi:hypothetical protein
VCEILVSDLSVLELCDTSDSSSKCHQLVTLRGCRLIQKSNSSRIEVWRGLRY